MTAENRGGTLGSVAGDGHAADLEGGCHDAIAEGEVVANHRG